MYKFISKCEQDTINFASKFAKKLQKKDIVVLSGELGSGKTKFVQGILKYFGLENEIYSPTFTIVNEYSSKVCPIYHFDVYRLADIDEFYAMGGEEYFENGICLIEWGELIENILPPNYIKVTFKKDNSSEDHRELKKDSSNEDYKKLEIDSSNENYRELEIETFGNKYINM